MTELSLQTLAEKKMQTMSVADTIVQRIVDEGVAHCFGVAGDYLSRCSPSVKWIGCANELNAAYAADGYARIRGAGMLATTYGVGELSALNGVMGAKAERSLVFHVVGMPSYQNQRLSKIAHHTLGDGHFGNFAGLSAAAACCSALINPDNCIIEMERVVGEARRNNQPAYILVPSDYALATVTPVEVRRLTLRSSAAMLKKAVEVVTERLKGARSVIVLPAFTIARLGLQKEFREAIEALGVPFATMLMEKCIIDESHPQFAGLYAGAMSAQSTREIVEGADLVLDLGGVSLNDITTAAYSAKLDPARFITIGLNDVRMGEKVIGGVRLADMLVELGKLKLNTAPFRRTVESAKPISGRPSDKITMDALYPRYAAFVRAGDTVVLETGSSTLSRDFLNDQRIDGSLPVQGSHGCVDYAVEGVGISEGLMGQMARLEIVPDNLDVVEFGCVFWQPLDGEPVFARLDGFKSELADMDRPVVLDQYDRFYCPSWLRTEQVVELLEVSDEVAAALGLARMHNQLARDMIE